MCGRFTLTVDEEKILVRFNSIKVIDKTHVKRYNIAPSQKVLAVVNDGEKNRLGQLRWGLIPFWAKDHKIGYKLINARAETIAEKPSFKHAFRRQRCLIPADGFYEWKNEAGRKQPYRIKLKSDEVFSFAGLWDRWQSPEGETMTTCTIITTEANPLLADLHHRMPVILHPEDEALWLDRDIDEPELLRSLLKSYPAEEMEVYPVSTRVNSAREDDPSLITRELK